MDDPQVTTKDAETLARIAPWLSDPLRQRRTKIVATIGPSSSATAVIEQLIRAGVNVFRLNFSHGDHSSHGAAYERVRAASTRLGAHVAVLADLCGPKIRVGQFAGGQTELTSGDTVVVTTRDIVGGPRLIPSQYEAFASDVRSGDRVLLDDGILELRVQSVDDRCIAFIEHRLNLLRRAAA